MANTLRFKRGLTAGLPASVAGEPLFTTDTFDLYIGTGAANQRFQKYIASGTTLQYLRGDGTLATFPILTGFVPYTGATANVDLGVFTILAQNATFASSGSTATATINHSSGSGIALNITKGGNGEGLYVNKTSGSGNAATILGTLNATTLVKSGGLSTEYLKADGSVSTLTNPITGTGASGQVAYWSGASTQAGNNNLFWDNTNGRLGIGTNAPSQKLHVIGAILNTVGFVLNRSDNYGFFTGASDDLGIYHNGTNSFISNASGALIFDNPTERMRIHAGGNVHIGGTSDSGQRLQVTGDTLLKGSGNTSATTALTVQNSSSQNILRVLNNGQTTLTGTTSNDTTTIFRIEQNGGNGRFLVNAAGQTIIAGDSFQSSESFLSIERNAFNPTSGNASHTSLRINPTINQTGGANGITRGLYILPTLTAAADWRSIEWSNNTGFGLYGVGTSLNYLNGLLLLGSTTSTGERLQVNGTMKVTGASTFGGNVTIPIGSYDAPSLSFSNDSNTGIFSPLADNLELKTGTNNAIVLENQGVNLKIYSQELALGGINYQNIGVGIPGGVVAPDGTTTANVATPDTSLNQHRFFYSITTTSPFTMSVYAKPNGYNFISMGWSGGLAGSAIIFDIVNGTISGTSSGHTAQIENAGNGWFRCSLIYTTTFTSTLFSRFIVVRNANSTANYSGDGTSGVYLWGFQIEENTIATSYIRTDATAVTRPQAVSVLSQNLYGNLITRKIGAPSLTDFALTTNYTDRLVINASTGAATFSSTITSNQTNGFTIGGLLNAARIQYGSDASTSFSLLTAANAFAGLYASSAVFSSNVTMGDNLIVGTTATTIGAMNFIRTNTSPVASRITFGTDGTGYSFVIGKNQAGTVTDFINLNDSGNFGIGISPLYKLDVTGEARVSSAIAIGTTPDTNKPFKILKNINATVGINFENTSTSSLAFSAIQMGTDVTGGTAFTNLVYGSSGVTEAGVFKPNGTSLINTGSGGLNLLAVSQPIRFFTSSGNGTLRAEIANDGFINHFTGTAPSTNATDGYRQYSADVVAGNAAPHFRTENGAVVKLYQETTGVGNAIFSAGGGTGVLDDSTFDGYTLRQIVKALRNQGILA